MPDSFSKSSSTQRSTDLQGVEVVHKFDSNTKANRSVNQVRGSTWHCGREESLQCPLARPHYARGASLALSLCPSISQSATSTRNAQNSHLPRKQDTRFCPEVDVTLPYFRSSICERCARPAESRTLYLNARRDLDSTLLRLI